MSAQEQPLHCVELEQARRFERAKYEHVYAVLPHYEMGGLRQADAEADVRRAYASGARTYLDIGCGRGEMLDFAEALGFETVQGVEIVPELCLDARVTQSFISDMGPRFDDGAVDLATSFDVLEHLIAGDDEILITELGRIARHHIVLTANNHRSFDATTGADLHINKRPYDEWDAMIRGILAPVWMVERLTGKLYISESWRATR